MLLTNVPMPVPSVVWLALTTGFAVMSQHTPRAVTAPPPSELMSPPLVEVVVAIDVTAEVVIVGKFIIEPFSTLNSFWQELNNKQTNVNDRIHRVVFMYLFFLNIANSAKILSIFNQ